MGNGIGNDVEVTTDSLKKWCDEVDPIGQ